MSFPTAESSCLPAVQRPSGAEGWDVANVCIFSEEEGLWWVFAQARNETGSSQEEVEVEVTLFGSDGSSAGEGLGYILVYSVPAGVALPVQIEVDSVVSPAEYQFDVISVPSTTTLRVDLQVLDPQLTYVDEDLLVVGQVHNPGSGLSYYAELIATLYDQDGAVVGVGYEFVDAEELGPSETASFEVFAEGLFDVVADYTVMALGF